MNLKMLFAQMGLDKQELIDSKMEDPEFKTDDNLKERQKKIGVKVSNALSEFFKSLEGQCPITINFVVTGMLHA